MSTAIAALLRRHALEAFRAVTGRHEAAGLKTAASTLDALFAGRACEKAANALVVDLRALARKVPAGERKHC